MNKRQRFLSFCASTLRTVIKQTKRTCTFKLQKRAH